MSTEDTGADTSEDTATAGEEQVAQPEDPIKNIKSEFGRKFEGIGSQLSQLSQELRALATQRTEQAAPARPQPSLKDQLFDDPDAAVETMTERATQRALQAADQMIANRQNMQNTIFNFTSEYPELGQAAGQAEVQRIHASLPKALRETPEGAELALTRAAAQMGLTPASRRRKPAGDDDGFIPKSSGSRSNQKKAEPEMSDEQFTFMHLLNESISRKVDDKVIKNASKYAGRKQWNKYGTGEES